MTYRDPDRDPVDPSHDAGHDHPTNDHAHDGPDDHGHAHDTASRDDDTRFVERERVVEREGYVPPPRPVAAPPAGSQVNVNASERYATTEGGAGPLTYVRRVLSLLFGILAVLLVLRILLLLLVANQTNALVDFVYSVTEPFVAPFRGVFAFEQVTPGGGSVLDIAALVALLGWFLIYLLIVAILNIGDRRSTA